MSLSLSFRHLLQHTPRNPKLWTQPSHNVGLSLATKRFSTKTYGTLPQPDASERGEGVMFRDTSKPRPYTHGSKRTLPRIPRKWPIITASIVLGISFWGLFLFYTTNASKLSSSITIQILRSIRSSSDIQQTLGDAIRVEPKWYLNGSGLIHGHIGVLKGDIDLSFRVRGSKGAGTVYFTSIRTEKGVPFTNLRFKVIADDGTVVQLDPSSM